jgi:hypothetical protein
MAQPPILRPAGLPARGSTNRGFASTDPERQRDFAARRAGSARDVPAQAPLEEVHDGGEDGGTTPAKSTR